MPNDTISQEEWAEYLSQLYEWIQEQYQEFLNDEISEQDYQEDLAYYEKEVARINQKIEASNIEHSVTEEKGEAFLNQDLFENFFGVSIDEKEEPEIEDSDHEIEFQKPEEYISEPQVPAEEKVETSFDPVEYTQSQEEFDVSVFKKTEQETVRANIVLIGDSGVGRSSIRRNFMGRNFIKDHLSTVAATMDKKQVEWNGIKYLISIIDLGGQDFYQSLRKNFYRNIDGAFLVFDVTRKETFTRMDHWIREFYRSISKPVPFLLLGNKKDARKRKVKQKDGERLATHFSSRTMPRFRVRYMETSAQSSSNVEEAFKLLCGEIRRFQKTEKKRLKR